MTQSMGARIIAKLSEHEYTLHILSSVTGLSGYAKSDKLGNTLRMWFARHDCVGFYHDNYDAYSMKSIREELETYQHNDRDLLILSADEIDSEIGFMVSEEVLAEELDQDDRYELFLDAHHGDPDAFTEIAENQSDLILRVLARTILGKYEINADLPVVETAAPRYEDDF